jgi:hypothetical protein
VLQQLLHPLGKQRELIWILRFSSLSLSLHREF